MPLLLSSADANLIFFTYFFIIIIFSPESLLEIFRMGIQNTSRRVTGFTACRRGNGRRELRRRKRVWVSGLSWDLESCQARPRLFLVSG